MRKQHGFTFWEVIIVLVVIAILAAIALPSYQNYSARLKGGPGILFEELNHAVVRTWFATDRNFNEAAGVKEAFGENRDKLKYGVADVSIPRDHRMGELESPSIFRFEFKENPDKHVVLLSVDRRTGDSFFAEIASKLDASGNKSALVFIHGYKTSFEDAARRTAQMSYDLAFKGVPVFYSWPSQAKLVSYTVDEQNIEWSQANIELFLEDFFEKSQAEKVYLIAHSMGNRGLTRALHSLVQKKPEIRQRLAEIILAAPDVDAEVFKRDIAPGLIASGAPVTLYASSGDKALRASKKVHGFPRAGESGELLVVLDGMETIDASNVATDFLGHSYFAESRSILSDIFNIVNNGQRAEARFGLEAVQTSDGRYWKFRN